MYAVIKTGGKQYRVIEGQTLKIEKLALDTGKPVAFDDVLLVATEDDVHVGAPFVKGAKVTAEVLDHGRADKISIIKFKRRKHQMKRQGHRQDFTAVKVTGIELGGKKLAAPAPVKKTAPKKKTAAKKVAKAKTAAKKAVKKKAAPKKKAAAKKK